MGHTSFSLRNRYGQRKYINKKERKAFIKASYKFAKEKRLFFHMLFWTGGRISEVLNITVSSIDFIEELVVLGTLKKRTKGHTREIPLPKHYLEELAEYTKSMNNLSASENIRLWSWCRRSGSRYIQAVMKEAKIQGGPQACAMGLRHGFAVNCVLHNIPLTTLQKWMGHAHISTTAIYANVMGKEERMFAKRMWK